MPSTNPLFFDWLPQRGTKPRDKGITMVRDDGHPLEQIKQALDSYGHLIDYMKFRQFVTWYLRPSELLAKIDACKQANVRTFLGGTVLEIAHLHGKTDYALDVMLDYGLTAVEVSHSMVALTTEQLSKVVGLASGKGLEVLYEYGKKFQEESFEVDSAVKAIKAIIAAGASRVIIERWQLDAALGEDGKSDSAHRIVELADAVGLEALVFEAESLEHQLWLLKELGPDINLGPNIQPYHVPSKLEPFRNGLGSEVDYRVFDAVAAKSAVDVSKLFLS